MLCLKLCSIFLSELQNPIAVVPVLIVMVVNKVFLTVH
jgi:hypothetical protein